MTRFKYMYFYLQYKHVSPIGSGRERRTLYHGHKELLEKTFDVIFEIPEVEYRFGQNIKFEVKMTNKGKQHRIKGRIICEAISYTGR